MSFEFMTNEESGSILETVYVSITTNDLWEWLKNYNSATRRGCIFNDHPNFKIIENTSTHSFVHTGHSWNWCMNIMEYIAKHDIESFKNIYIRNTTI
tara:strand:+ start:2665 stop:2955 length:291 start_codon:yes stop_codon:yes gene_type:complete